MERGNSRVRRFSLIGALRAHWRIVVWLVLGSILLSTPSANAVRYLQFARFSVQTFGTARSVENDVIRYAYVVGGGRYEGAGSGGFGNPSTSHVDVGDPIRVAYLPDAPAESLLGDPRARLEQEIILLVALGLVVPSLVLMIQPLLTDRRGRGSVGRAKAS